MPAKPERIGLSSGSLSQQEIEGIFSALPVDITFVSPKDEVMYFSKLGKRIFPRSLAVVGRKVQMCHPQKSLDKVNALLSGFKSGRRDSAEFWIGMNGRIIHIRYFAVRSTKGKYLGCLEVSQDITEIQKLKGEKRL